MEQLMASQYGEDIAVLKEQMNKTVLPTLLRIEAKQDLAMNTYATKSELRTFKFVTVPGVILVSALIGALVSFYFAHQPMAANNPTTSSTTTTTTPTGSTGVTTTRAGTPSANANAQSKSDTATPSDSQNSSDNGGVNVTLPKVP